MEASATLLFSIGSLVGTLLTGFLTIGYWMLKVRKDVNAAHEAIRTMKKTKVKR